MAARSQASSGPDIFAILGGLFAFVGRLSFPQRIALLGVLFGFWLLLHYGLWGTVGPSVEKTFPGADAFMQQAEVKWGEGVLVVAFLGGITAYVVLRRKSVAWQEAQNDRLAARAKVFQILVPQGDPTRWEAMENFYLAIRQALACAQMDIWQGRALHLSLEFASTPESMACYIWLPDATESHGINLVSTIVTQLRAVYREVFLDELEADYFVSKELQSGVMSWVELGLARESFYPLQTQFGPGSDPLSNLLSALTPDAYVQGLGFQVLCRPASSDWAEQGARQAVSLNEQVAASQVKANAGESRTLAKAIEEKRDRLGYDVRVRLWGVSEAVERSSDKALEQRQDQATGHATTGGGREEGSAESVRSTALPLYRSNVSQRLGTLAGAFRLFDDHNQWVVRRQGTDARLVVQRRWLPFSRECVLNCQELAALFHLPGARTAAPGLATLPVRRVAPVPSMVVPEGQEKHYRVLGLHQYGDGRPVVAVGVSYKMALRHMVGIGQTGTGKSTLIVNCAVQDIRNGHGVVVMDPHFDLISDILERVPPERLNDVVLLDPLDKVRRIAINPLEVLPGEDPTRVATDMLDVFRIIMGANWDTSVRMQAILRTSIMTLVRSGPNRTLFDLRRMLTDRAVLEEYALGETDPVLREEWQNYLNQDEKKWLEMVQPPLTRISRLLTHPVLRYIFAQPRSTIRWRELIDGRAIVLCNFSRVALGSDNATALTAMTFSLLYRAFMSRLEDTAEEERVPCYVYVDEAPDLVNPSANEIEDMFSQVRKAGGGLNLFAQYMSQFAPTIQDAITGNVFCVATFRVGQKDAKAASNVLGEPVTAQDAMGLPPYYIFARLAGYGKALVKTLPKPPVGTANDFPLPPRLAPVAPSTSSAAAVEEEGLISAARAVESVE